MTRTHVAVAWLCALSAVLAVTGCKTWERYARNYESGGVIVEGDEEASSEPAGAGPEDFAAVSPGDEPEEAAGEAEPSSEEPQEEDEPGDKGIEKPGAKAASGAKAADEEPKPSAGSSGKARKPAGEDEDKPKPDAKPASTPPKRAVSAAAYKEILLGPLATDLTIAVSQVEEADKALTQEDLGATRQRINKACVALTFAAAEVPAVVARQNCERAMSLVARGDAAQARDAVQRAMDLAGEIELRGSVKSFEIRGRTTIELLAAGDGTEALDELSQMARAIKPSEGEEALGDVQAHLLGALGAVDRGAAEVAAAELRGARTLLWELLDSLSGGEAELQGRSQRAEG